MFKTKKKAFTIIETVIVIAILSALSSSLYVVFKSGMDAWSRSDARLDVFQHARAILDQLSRELPNAFTGTFSQGDAEFTGVNGTEHVSDPDDPDTIEFVMLFGDSFYKVKYGLLAGNILQRGYIKDPDDYSSTDYATDGDASIEEAEIDFSDKVSNIQFRYLPQGSTASNAWDDGVTAQTAWDPATDGGLPEAIEIVLTLIDPTDDDDLRTYTFETKVYLPNSE